MGHTTGFTGIGKDSDEAEKRITAKLLAGGQVVVLDNVKHTLDLGPLEAALTEPTWEGRIITTSKWVTLKNRATWIATGNGLTFGEEMARRVYMIELESKLERPADRPAKDFAHHPLVPWVMAERPRLLSAVLTLVAAWASDGMRLTDGPPLGSFEEWAGTVGSVLRFVGLSDFLGNETRKREVAEDDPPINRETLLLRMREAAGDADFTLRELHGKAVSAEFVAAVAPFLDAVRWEDEEAVTKLGNALRPVVDGVYGGLKLIREGKNSRRGGRLFRIVEA
jgi:putative DNA primase/helicase